ncbi:MAG TPA: hypothetical protein VF011_11210 [Terriglobales bacterium]
MRSPIAWCGFLVLVFCLAAVALAQQNIPDTPQPTAPSATPATTPSPATPQPSTSGTPPVKETTNQTGGKKDFGKTHIFWVIPNYRADEGELEIKALTPKQKFKVALDDSFDPSAFLVAGVFAGISMAQRQYPHFGVGAAGFGKYYGGAFADQAVGNFMTEALFPIALHQDPRYFTKGKGGFFRRTGYAMSREVITLGDDGRNHFNTSELAGNFVAAGVSNLYYPAADRSFGNTVNKWGQQLALDTFFNVMKEFWPDLRRKVFRASY